MGRYDHSSLQLRSSSSELSEQIGSVSELVGFELDHGKYEVKQVEILALTDLSEVLLEFYYQTPAKFR